MLEGELLAEMTGMDASLQDLLFQNGCSVVVFFLGFPSIFGS